MAIQNWIQPVWMERGWGSEVKTDTVMPTWSFDERGSTWFRLRRGKTFDPGTVPPQGAAGR